MYTPDRSFMKDLQTLDSRLDVKFNGRNFVVTYARGYGDPVNVWVVKAEDGGFRQPDRRDIAALSSGDMAKQTPREYLDKRSRYFEEVREKMRRDSRETIRNLTKDNKRQLKKAAQGVYDSMGIEIPFKPPLRRRQRSLSR